MTPKRWITVPANLLAALWIFGGAGLHFSRFSWAFYQANRAAVERVVCKLLGHEGLAP